MIERPILFNKTEVLATLAGRKSQTRYPLSKERWWKRVEWIAGAGDDPNDPSNWGFEDENGDWFVLANATCGERNLPCKYGQLGDRLWVREAWYCDDFRYPSGPRDKLLSAIEYRADHRCRDWGAGCPCADEDGRSAWRSSVHMPRWASRIVLEIMNIRVERVQSISENDVIAEGLSRWSKDGQLKKWGIAKRHISGELDFAEPWTQLARSPAKAFARFWDSVNKKNDPWTSNPWVRVIEFKMKDSYHKKERS